MFELGFSPFSQYLKELLAEHQKLGPFVQVLPICSRLLNQGLFVCLFVYFNLIYEFEGDMFLVSSVIGLYAKSVLMLDTITCSLLLSGLPR